jgi:hypothetical protein
LQVVPISPNNLLLILLILLETIFWNFWRHYWDIAVSWLLIIFVRVIWARFIRGCLLIIYVFRRVIYSRCLVIWIRRLFWLLCRLVVNIFRCWWFFLRFIILQVILLVAKIIAVLILGRNWLFLILICSFFVFWSLLFFLIVKNIHKLLQNLLIFDIHRSIHLLVIFLKLLFCFVTCGILELFYLLFLLICWRRNCWIFAFCLIVWLLFVISIAFCILSMRIIIWLNGLLLLLIIVLILMINIRFKKIWYFSYILRL